MDGENCEQHGNGDDENGELSENVDGNNAEDSMCGLLGTDAMHSVEANKLWSGSNNFLNAWIGERKNIQGSKICLYRGACVAGVRSL